MKATGVTATVCMGMASPEIHREAVRRETDRQRVGNRVVDVHMPSRPRADQNIGLCTGPWVPPSSPHGWSPEWFICVESLAAVPTLVSPPQLKAPLHSHFLQSSKQDPSRHRKLSPCPIVPCLPPQPRPAHAATRRTPSCPPGLSLPSDSSSWGPCPCLWPHLQGSRCPGLAPAHLCA